MFFNVMFPSKSGGLQLCFLPKRGKELDRLAPHPFQTRLAGWTATLETWRWTQHQRKLEQRLHLQHIPSIPTTMEFMVFYPNNPCFSTGCRLYDTRHQVLGLLGFGSGDPSTTQVHERDRRRPAGRTPRNGGKPHAEHQEEIQLETPEIEREKEISTKKMCWKRFPSLFKDHLGVRGFPPYAKKAPPHL